jgi:FkbM family methyltransferase
MLRKGIWNKDTYLEIVDASAGKDSFMVRETHDKSNGGIEATSVQSIMQNEGWANIDLLKVDIEGAEKELFSENYENWLPSTRAIIIEIHDHMKKGCSTSVFKAISNYNFSFSMKHENLVFINEDL